MDEKTIQTKPAQTAKDYSNDQMVRWCPGCGDYSILKQMQVVLAEVQIPNHNIVMVSGIGCSSRFPHYMNTYGLHSIHGRSLTFASGIKLVNPELSVWCITGDGDGLSIGVGHTAHALRRNFNINILLFNNQIYGLTKGQYSPTSEFHKVTKSSPNGSFDTPLNPLSFALNSEGSFIARSMDRDPKHLKSILHQSNNHQGTSFIEIYQNCNVFNDGTFEIFTEKNNKAHTCLFLEEGKPLVYGSHKEFGIALDGLKPIIVNLNENNISLNDLWIHTSSDFIKSSILTRFFDTPNTVDDIINKKVFPRPFGVLYKKERVCYENAYNDINNTEVDEKKYSLHSILHNSDTWII